MSLQLSVLYLAAFAVALVVALLSAVHFLYFREGLFSRVGRLNVAAGAALAIHAFSRIAVPDPYADISYAATGLGTAVIVFLTVRAILGAVQRIVRGEGLPRR